MTDNALDQVLTDIVTLTDPDQETLLWIGQQKAAPLVAVFNQVM
ncbi:hypothetical protein APX70_05335 [Pseudomonas syringae pv. maculicola]|uniref:Uncharacterized protein n=1 Tax=Pseudomonas syringae pv. maculicola TaxID=59511 RepID=A0A3M2YZH3_PSEYM|nr:hypothetical protein APX70_05335 [Pseudomonas syringae pv. maculicola]